MGKRPSDKHSVDRYPDNDGNYEPANCRWATKQEQAANTRRNKKIKIGSETKCFSEWAREAGVHPETFSNRVQANWNHNDLFRPPTRAKQLEFNGKTMTVREWSVELGMSCSALYERFSAGWTIEEALKTPPKRKLSKQ